ncbi:MAG: prepilin-type N-terminal cleavage/methylation domain-containing protein [Planctomycetes bacterium]|nr:prepilin-type N-terminal cleavage/methylation domain-containing protein [Planctomycetota bacterium]
MFASETTQFESVRAAETRSGCRSGFRAFTLVELLVVVTLISIMLALSAFTFRSIRDSGQMAMAKNAILTYAGVARSYAIEHHIETTMAINPYNGRFEIWHLNPPAQGGAWDPFSGGISPPFTDGYAFAPVLDRAASLPVDSSGRPAVAVFPVDYDDPAYRPTANTEPNLDNLMWTMFCFDENGRMVTRTRRIATRSFNYRDGTPRAVGSRNRLPDETPDLSLLEMSPAQALVMQADTAVTSTRGFVICDWTKAVSVVGASPTPIELITGLLREMRPGRRFSQLGETILMDRYSAKELVGDKR